METIFCDTTEVRKAIKQLYAFRQDNWKGFEGGQNTFANLQQKIMPEIEYLKGFWDEQCVNDHKFWAWNCIKAYDDTPEWKRCQSKTGYRYLKVSKYEIFHDRESYLEELNEDIWSLFHDWQFVTQGWTAY